MTSWQTAFVEASETYSPVGLHLVDEFTNDAPLGETTAYLDILNAGGAFRQTDVLATRTASGVVCYPGLERHADIAGLSKRHYRVRISADLYVPFYQNNSDGIEFDAYPFNDANPPQSIVHLPQDVFLTPAPNYPFPTHVPVLRGMVVNAAKNPVPNALVTQGASVEQVVTDSRGVFALPLRWVSQNVPTPIDAVDHRTGHLGNTTITLPADLGKNLTIKII